MRLICSIFIGLVAATVLGQSTPVSAQMMGAKNPISIKQCFIIEPKMLSKNAGGTQIDYVNHGAKTASTITFAVGYRNAAQHFLRRVTDYGTFAPGTEVSHRFNLYNDVTYAGKQTQGCAAIAVKWSDGTSWHAQ
jgi:hypothetical protein